MHNSGMALPLAVVLLTGIVFVGFLITARRRHDGVDGPPTGIEQASMTDPATLELRRTLKPTPQEVRSCPVCHGEYPGHSHFCVRDGAELVDGPPTGPFSHGMICPTCRRGYPGDASFCPEDADELVPYGLYGAASSTRPPQPLDSTKICPECGDRHASTHAFCGRDGAELVVVN